MHLWLADRLARKDTDPKQFFRAAYMWRFEKDADITRDLITYQVGGIVPEYVREYVNHIQLKEKANAMQKVP